MELLNEINTHSTEQETPIPLLEAFDYAIKQLNLSSKGGLETAVNGAKSLFARNPDLVAGTAALAVSALATYNKNKRNTIHLHARDPYEKKMMTSIVDALQHQGRFKVHQIKIENGGKTWVLKRQN